MKMEAGAASAVAGPSEFGVLKFGGNLFHLGPAPL